jgi:hypothetical protein
MTKPLVRKFQLPAANEASSGTPSPAPDTTAKPQPVRLPATDFDIPEINTNFIDNLFTDPTFVDRFDVAFGQTVPMGLEAEKKPSATRPDPEEWQSMLDISFNKTPGA